MFTFLFVSCNNNKDVKKNNESTDDIQGIEIEENKLNNSEEEIAEIALSFHKWYIKTTNNIDSDVPVGFVVAEGDNDNCLVDYQPYFNELRKLGTISEKFMNSEKERTNLCVETIKKMDWSEYIGVIPENCDNYFYWTRRQDKSGGVEVLNTNQIDNHWEVNISVNKSENAIVRLENENGKYMITEIKWVDKNDDIL